MRAIRILALVLIVHALPAAVMPAQGADFLYTGLDGRIVSFSVPTRPALVPGFVADPAGFFGLSANVVDSLVGPDPVARDFTFYELIQSGGLFFFPDPILSLAGAQLFTGSVSDPTFSAGVYALNFFDIDTLQVGDLAGTLTISGIPEPASLALLGIGMLGLAVTLGGGYPRHKFLVPARGTGHTRSSATN